MLTVLLQAGRPSREPLPGLVGGRGARTRAGQDTGFPTWPPQLCRQRGPAASSRRAPGPGVPPAVLARLEDAGQCVSSAGPPALGHPPPSAPAPRPATGVTYLRSLSHLLWHLVFYLYSSYNPWGGSRAFLSVLSRKEIRAQSNLAPDPERYFTFLFKTHLSQGAGPGEVGSLRASLWDLIKTQAPMRRIWGAARDSAFLTSTQVTPGGRLGELPELSRASIPQEAK